MKALFLVFFLSMASSAQGAETGCDSFATRITTTPVPYEWPSGLEKASALLSSPPRRADTILIGDSLLAFWPRDLAETQFGAHRVWNFAVGGSQTQHVLWLLDHLAAAPSRPREVIILIGTNNLSDTRLSACAIAEGIRSVATRAREIWPETAIRLMGIPPRGSDFRFRDEDRKAINSAVASWAGTRTDMLYFEVDERVMTCGLHGGTEVADTDPSTPNGSRCDNYADDFGHFRRPGYDVIFTALRGATK